MDTIELIKMAQNGDEEAFERIITENTPLIWSVVKHFLNRKYDAEDLFQVGALGLIKSVKKFDLSYNVKFSTYAVPMIMGELKRFMRDDGFIKVSRPLKELAVKINRKIESILKETGREPTIDELAKFLNVSREDIVSALESSRDVESIYSTVYQGESNDICLMDKLVAPDTENKTIDSIVINEMLERLDEKERNIVRLRYFEDKTQTETAEIIGISQVQVSRSEKKILQKLRNLMQ